MTKGKDDKVPPKPPKPIITKSHIQDKTVVEEINHGFTVVENKLMNYFDRLDKKVEKMLFYLCGFIAVVFLSSVVYFLIRI